MSVWGPVTYRVYDEGDRLIYVGSTRDFDERLRQHWYSSWWMGLAHRFDLEQHYNMIQARGAETRAISGEAPAFNVNSSGKAQLRARPLPLTEEEQCMLRAWAAANPKYAGRLPRAFRWALAAGTSAAA